MANQFNYQLIEDGPRNAVVKLTGILDTSNLALTDAVQVSGLVGNGILAHPTKVRIDHIDYAIQDQIDVILFWEATTNMPILPLAGRGRMNFGDFTGLPNNGGAGMTGNILIETLGWTSATQIFTLVLNLIKQYN